MKKLYKYIIISIILLCASILHAQVEYVIDFNSYQQGNLDGIDNWSTIAHFTGTGDFDIAYSGGDLISPDETVAVFYNHGGPNVGRTATRKATDNFNFTFQNGGIIDLEMDVFKVWWGAFFGIGFDSDGDGNVTPGLVENDGGVYLRYAAHDGETAIYLPNGDKVAMPSYTHDGWSRFKLSFNFNAFDGQGSVTVFAKPNCEGEWLQIAEATEVNMHLTPGSGDKNDYKVWDGIFFHSQGAVGGFDNLVVRQMPDGNMQYISMEDIPNQLISNPPITLNASATSGLPVDFEIVSGPASLNGNILTLSGEPGQVTIKAFQTGDDNWLPAPDVFKSFNVYDPNDYTPEVTIRRPYNETNVYISQLDPILLVVSAYIEHSDVIHIEKVVCNLDGQSIEAKSFFPDDPDNGYYSCLWTPSAIGDYDMTVDVYTTGGKVTTLSNTFTVTDEVESMDIVTMHGELVCDPQNHYVTANYIMPSHVGVFNDINAFYQHNCVGGNCDTYDRVGGVRVRDYKGQWIELFRYISPFGVECEDNIDVTDFSTILQGLVEFEYFFVTWNGSGYNPTLTFNYTAGSPEYKYVDVDEIWFDIYDFGDYSNLQPVPDVNYIFNPSVEKATIKMITTGHNWSSNSPPDYTVNTDNAAEFYEATHHIFINNQSKFDQHLWPQSGSCSPNPAGCQPQAGTWTYGRAGWCPGSMAMVWDWDISEYIGAGSAIIGYKFDDYIDYCHPNHPDCVSGQNGCPNCDAPNNPILQMSGKVVNYSNDAAMIGLDVNDDLLNTDASAYFYPNPSKDIVSFKSFDNSSVNVIITDLTGRVIKEFSFIGTVDVSVKDYPAGSYLVRIINKEKSATGKLIIY